MASLLGVPSSATDTGDGRTPVPTAPVVPLRLPPDSLSGHLPAWVKSRFGGPASAKQSTQELRIALPASFAIATRTASYKNENDDATFLERHPDGLVVAGL